ncbi:MAG TPA: hypothetical protein VLJ88_07420, partial [Propionibacteriaceae bacterium]|nr:hypothetical protein [Propionibacteriaceae bacterium]
MTTSVALRGAVSARLTRTGLTDGQEIGAPLLDCDGVRPGVGVPDSPEPEPLEPGVGEAESGVSEPPGDGELLDVGVLDSTVSLADGVAGVRPPVPPEQPASGRSTARAIAPTHRRAGVMGEAYG